jgi:hypothetical protein
MKLLRFVLPFLFVRNWYDGTWELSRPRSVIFGGVVFLFLSALLVVYILQAPVRYTA